MELRFNYLEMEILKEIYYLFLGVITARLLLSCGDNCTCFIPLFLNLLYVLPNWPEQE